MSQPELEQLAPDILRLLESEKSRPAPHAAMQARVLERIGNDLMDGVPWPGPVGDGMIPPSTQPPPVSILRLHRLPLAVGLVTLGGIGGAGVHALLQEKMAAVPVPALMASPPDAMPEALPSTSFPPPQVPIEPEKPRRPATTPIRRVVPPAPVPPASFPSDGANNGDRQLARDAELAAERALLEQARMALARGKATDALVSLTRHAREFTHGRLVEEREALMILSLVANRQTDAARVHANAFRQKYPTSMLLRSIDAAFEPRP